MSFPGQSFNDSGSVYSRSSSHFETEAKDGRLMPRSGSTSDLFEVPSSRVKPKPYRRFNSSRALPTQNLSHIPEKRQNSSPAYLASYERQLPQLRPQPRQQVSVMQMTPYQMQRRQMKNSFQFPNGESFTPRNQSVRTFQNESGGRMLPKSASCSNFHPVSGQTHQTPSIRDSVPGPLIAIPARPSSELNRRDNLHLTPPNLPRNDLKRYSSLSSLSKLPTYPSAPVNPPVAFGLRNDTNSQGKNRPSPTRANPSIYSHNNFSSLLPKAQVASSNTSTSNSSNSLRSENVVSSNTSSSPSEAAEIPDVVKRGSLRTNSKRKHELQVTSKHPSVQSIKATSNVEKSTCANSKDAGPSPSKTDINAVEDKLPTLKRSRSSRLGSFFKKLLPSTKKQQAKMKPSKSLQHKLPSVDVDKVKPPMPHSNGTKSSSMNTEPQKDRSESPTSDETKKDGTDIYDLDDIDLDDDESDMLMDIDLVFDSLLLKSDHSRITRAIQSKTQQSDPASTGVDTTPDLPATVQSQLQQDTLLDPKLINDFSKLGSLIDLEKEQGTKKSVPDPRSYPPPRSQKRPRLLNKDSAVGFYRQHASKGNTPPEFTEALLQDLYRDWHVVHLNCNVTSLRPSIRDKTLPKSVRFGDSVFVNDTYAAADYERSDKTFIKMRRKIMQKNSANFVSAIKLELNEFKRNEMPVHEDSSGNTHFFY
ncbi:LAMI_0H11804g1_1 [Lachancea mirantina]|uniref:LAMI_0H11804g1_1 n=1 Tax=Lachancea mirantina TaxID=1230905 RepID=A0A1G4KHC9_9SACH|nr:LAMI_0H11804g1_1 [Lachancea mirantina]